MRSLNVQMPTPECHGHASFLMAFCSFLGESSSLSAAFSVISCLHAVLLCERWGRRSICISVDGGWKWSGHTSVQLKASAVYFPWCCALFFTLTHALESTAQYCFSPLDVTFTGAAAKTASPHCPKLPGPEVVLTDRAWLWSKCDFYLTFHFY